MVTGQPESQELKMLSLSVDERVEIARRLTNHGFEVRNESASTEERFIERITNDPWDLIFLNARAKLGEIESLLATIKSHQPDASIFGIVEPSQQNQEELLGGGFRDLFESDDLQRLPSSVGREIQSILDHRIAEEAKVLQEQVRFAVDEREVLAEIGRLVSSSLDIGTVYPEIIEQVAKVIPLDTAAIATVDLEDASVTIDHVAGDDVQGFEQSTVFDLSQFTPANLLARFVLVLDTDVLYEMQEEFDGIDSLLEQGVRSIMAAPLIHRDEVVGFLATVSKLEHAYQPEHVEVAERVSAQIAGALANSRLHARITRIASVREILVQLGRDVSSARDTAQLYSSVFENLRSILPVDRGVVALINDSAEALVVDHVDGLDVKGLGKGDSVALRDLSPEILSDPLISGARAKDDSPPDDPVNRELPQAGLNSNIRVPLRVRDTVMGIIYLTAKGDSSYTRADLALLERVSAQISPVIESLNLFNRVQSLAAAVETTLDLVAITNLNGVTSYMNPAGCRILNLENDASGIGVDLKSFMTEKDVDAIGDFGLPQAESSGGWQTEIQIRPSGSDESIPVGILIFPVRNQAGEMNAVNVFMRCEALQTDRREFVSAVSHELRTPLTSMRMYTDLLDTGDAGELNEKQKLVVDNLKSTVGRLTRMVDDLNVVSLIELGRFGLNIDDFDLGDLVDSAKSSSQPVCDERSVTVVNELSGSDLKVLADRGRTQQILVNLLNNAGKYGNENSAVVVAATADSEFVTISVTDSGPGIAAEEIERIFENFYRSTDARRSRVSGSGLGLSIANGLVEAQSGKLWVESVVGTGSTFSFTLPLA